MNDLLYLYTHCLCYYKYMYNNVGFKQYKHVYMGHCIISRGRSQSMHTANLHIYQKYVHMSYNLFLLL